VANVIDSMFYSGHFPVFFFDVSFDVAEYDVPEY